MTVAQQPSKADLKFWEFHLQNPQVYQTLVFFARQARAAGKQRIGIRMLWERMRWEFFIQTNDASSDFKLNNNYHSRYARLIMASEPDLVGAFEIRALHT